MRITLYYAPGSCSLALQIALEEAGASYDAKGLILAEGDQKRPEYLAINPRGRVPALVVAGTIISEAVAGVAYVAEAFPAVGLLPVDDAVLLGRAWERLAWYASSLQVANSQIWRTERFTDDQTAWPAIKAGGRAALEQGFQEIEERMEGPWVLGERYSIVDGYTQIFWRWGERLEIDMAKAYPRWARQSSALTARPAVQRALELDKRAQDNRI